MGKWVATPLLSIEFRTNKLQIYSMFRVEDEIIQRLKVDTPMIPNINTTLMDIPEAQTSFKPGSYSKHFKTGCTTISLQNVKSDPNDLLNRDKTATTTRSASKIIQTFQKHQPR